MFLFSKSIIFGRTTTDWRVLSRGSVKTRFKAIFEKGEIFDLVWNLLIFRLSTKLTKRHKNQNYQKLGLGLNFKKYNSSFAPASQQRIKRLNQRRKRTNTRFKQQFDLFWERESRPGRTGPARLSLSQINQTGA